MKIYGIKNCDTCRKAIKLLESAGNHVLFQDVREMPLNTADLHKFHAEFGAELVNTRSKTWRGLSELERAQPPLDLLAAHPTLMKRPVIEAEALYLGWRKDVQAALL